VPFLLTKQNQFARITSERTGFSARPDVNQGGLSVSGLKKLLSILEAIFVCQEQKWHFEGKNGEYNHRRATSSENAAAIR
jgi:hypothetical protein